MQVALKTNIPRVLYGIRAVVTLLCVHHDTNGEYEMFEETVENNKSFTSMCTYINACKHINSIIIHYSYIIMKP